MLKLKNVSKFYYSKGLVASGFTKIDLELKMGEFVVITGESGSGKSTLLNVISGLDTYEEGEMYVNGEETSHYSERDFEEYRKNYIGNIFQNFNLINSYTVYQNIELILLINGTNEEDIKVKVNDLIEKVGLSKYRGTKVSKLSGGQKQRVAIARALAKDSKIIVADEPTGNLDQKSARSIIELLNKLSKDRLVVVVTHNYEQFEEYATRKIKMFDGKIVEDIKIKEIDENIEVKISEFYGIKTSNKFKLGFRNTFNVFTKFFLLFVVYIFIIFSISSLYANNLKNKEVESNMRENYFLTNKDKNRLIVTKEDKSLFSKEDVRKIENLDNIDYVFEDDYLMDFSVDVSLGGATVYSKVDFTDQFDLKLIEGRMPENANEVLIEVIPFVENTKTVDKVEIGQYGSLGYYSIKDTFEVVGRYKTSSSNHDFYSSEGSIYFHEDAKESIKKLYFYDKAVTEMKLDDINLTERYIDVEINDNVPKGTVFVNEEFDNECKKGNCLNKEFSISGNIGFEEKEVNLNVGKKFTAKNFEDLTGLKSNDGSLNNIYISREDYESLFEVGTIQIGVFTNDFDDIDETIVELEKMNLNVVKVEDTLTTMNDFLFFINLFKVIFAAIFLSGLLFIAYFVIKLILKSRNIYFTTIRILGASKKVAAHILHIELWTMVVLTYLVFISILTAASNGILKHKMFANLKGMTEILKFSDYIILFIGVILFSFLISNRYSRKIFKKSAMNTFREEV